MLALQLISNNVNFLFGEICIIHSPGGKKKLRLKRRTNDCPAVPLALE